jgi:hypothetical protein
MGANEVGIYMNFKIYMDRSDENGNAPVWWSVMYYEMCLGESLSVR